MKKKHFFAPLLCAFALSILFTNCAMILNSNNSDVNKIKEVLGIGTQKSSGDEEDSNGAVNKGSLDVYETDNDLTYYYSNFENLTLKNGEEYKYTFPVEENYTYYIVVKEYYSSSETYASSDTSNIQLHVLNSSKTTIFYSFSSTNFPCITNDTYTLKLKITDETSSLQVGVQIMRKSAYFYTSYSVGNGTESQYISDSDWTNYKVYCSSDTLYKITFTNSSVSGAGINVYNTDSSFEFYETEFGTYYFLSENSGYAIIRFISTSSSSSGYISFSVSAVSMTELTVYSQDSSYSSDFKEKYITQSDWYYANLVKGKTYYIHYLDYYSDSKELLSTPKLDALLYVFDPDGYFVTLYNDSGALSNDYNDDDEYIHFTAEQSGKFLIEVMPRNSNSYGYIGLRLYTLD